MDIHLKIIITCVGLWIIVHFMAFPSTSFAEWGKDKLGGYGAFLISIAFVLLVMDFFLATPTALQNVLQIGVVASQMFN